MSEIGDVSMCPCGSGFEFGRCHGLLPPAPRPKTPYAIPSGYVGLDEAEAKLTPQVANAYGDGLGYQRMTVLEGDSCRDCSTIVIIPMRSPMVHYRVFTSWMHMITPMNQKRHIMICHGDEVGIAYNRMITDILAHPELSKWKYILTLESDNIIPQDAHIRLLESIERGKYDGVGGMYWTKGDIQRPMAYGDPVKYATQGVLEFEPRNVADVVNAGMIMEVNGVAMGCTLYRMDLFREVPHPWFVTVADVIEGKGAMGFTQDLFFCRRARMMGKRFAVDCRVRAGHLDEATGTVY